MESLGLFIDLILLTALLLRVDSASNRNEYYRYLMVCKGSSCVGLTTLPPSYADCLEILGASTFGDLRACSVLYVIALPLLLQYSNIKKQRTTGVRIWYFTHGRAFYIFYNIICTLPLNNSNMNAT